LITNDFFHGRAGVAQDFKKALELFLRARMDDPYNAIDRLIGICYMKLHEYDRAVFHFAEYIRKHAGECNFLLAGAIGLMACCYEKMNDTLNAKKYFNLSIEMYSKYAEWLERGNSPESILQRGDALLLIGFFNEKIGRLAIAEDSLQKSLPFIQNILGFSHESSAWNWKEPEGIEYFKLKELELTTFNKALLFRVASRIEIQQREYNEAKSNLHLSVQHFEYLVNVMETKTDYVFPDRYWYGARYGGIFQDFGEIYRWELTQTKHLYSQVNDVERVNEGLLAHNHESEIPSLRNRCKNCGVINDRNFNYCGNCGNKL
jgi:tetratricopeptide (TPR) repeat protein